MRAFVFQVFSLPLSHLFRSFFSLCCFAVRALAFSVKRRGNHCASHRSSCGVSVKRSSRRSFPLALLFAAILFHSLAFPAAAYDYTEKVFLWKGVPGMETQIRDTILYFVPAQLEKKKASQSPKSASALSLPQDSEAAAGEPFTFPSEENARADFSETQSAPLGKDCSSSACPAVIICPGGSYHHLGMPHEGFASARWFASVGIHAFVLRYRVAYNEHHFPAQLEDIQMAIAHVRQNAEHYGVDASKVGAIGYSAGGHLVTMAGAFSSRNELEKLGVQPAQSLRPDFIMPIYPVVSMQDDIAHKWSRKSLLGHKYSAPDAEKGLSLFNLFGHRYSQKLKDEFSMELQVPDDMPPVFILACEDDPVVMFENSVRLDASLSAKNISHVFISYDEGGHGFGMKATSKIMKAHHWNDEDLLPWLKEIGIID